MLREFLYMLDTPVALFVFRRPDHTRRVFDVVASARPRQLLVVCDGPRAGRADDAELVEQTRAVIERVDWPCAVHTNFSPHNLGCGRCLSQGLSWVFETVEQAIILEDDCLPHPSFFRYCAGLLEKYRDHPRVMAICGTNYFPGQSFGTDSYWFSKYFLCWGWATWRRAWQHYDYQMVDYPRFRGTQLRSLCDSRAEFHYYRRRLDEVYRRRIDTWDYQCLYSFWRQQGLCVHPHVNLVSNIGTSSGTHTGDAVAAETAWNAALPTSDIGELRHPSAVVRNVAADRHLSRHAVLHPPKPTLSWPERWKHRAGKWRRSLAKRAGFLFRAAS